MDNNTSRRAIISVTVTDVDECTRALDFVFEMYDNDALPLSEADLVALRQWRHRFFSIREILTDHVPVHFTDLGIEL